MRIVPGETRLPDFFFAAAYTVMVVLAVLYLTDIQQSVIMGAANGTLGERVWEWAMFAGATVAFIGSVAPRRHLPRGRTIEAMGAIVSSAMIMLYLVTVVYTKVYDPDGTGPSEWATIPWATVSYGLVTVILFSARVVYVMVIRGHLVATIAMQEKVDQRLNGEP